MKKQTKTKPPEWKEAELVPDTPESMAYGFTARAEAITKNKYGCNGQKADDVYDSYDRAVRNWRDLTKQRLNIDLPGPPVLPGNDYYAGMIGLAQYCQACAETLIRPDVLTDPVEYSDDCTRVKWYDGHEHVFNNTQAEIVKLLHDSDSPMHEKKIAERINTVAKDYRLVNSFRRNRKYHPAWRTMIVHVGKGYYTLAKPKTNNP